MLINNNEYLYILVVSHNWKCQASIKNDAEIIHLLTNTKKTSYDMETWLWAGSLVLQSYFQHLEQCLVQKSFPQSIY